MTGDEWEPIWGVELTPDQACHTTCDRHPLSGDRRVREGGVVSYTETHPPMTRPVLLDLFCGAGGAAMGYNRAGFDVIGVDNRPQPHYPFEFHQADAMATLPAIEAWGDGQVRWQGRTIDAIHASPPCHDHSTVTGRNRKASGVKGTGWMLNATIRHLQGLNLPWVVENVETADFVADVYRIRLCGSSFGLDVRRHRWFATNIAILTPPCAHRLQTPRFRSLGSRRAEGSLAMYKSLPVPGVIVAAVEIRDGSFHPSTLDDLADTAFRQAWDDYGQVTA